MEKFNRDIADFDTNYDEIMDVIQHSAKMRNKNVFMLIESQRQETNVVVRNIGIQKNSHSTQKQS